MIGAKLARWAGLRVDERRSGASRARSTGKGAGGKRAIGTGTVMSALLVLAPLAFAGELYGFGSVFVFTCSALACVPLSYWMGRATESLSSRLGPVSSGLLNATFGNAAELIIAITALSQGLFIVVRTTLIGSILGQLLLVLGTSLLVAGLRHKNLVFSQPLVQINFTLMAIALVAISLPSLLAATAPSDVQIGASLLTPVLSVLLLTIYAFAVVFSLRNQPHEEADRGDSSWTLRRAFLVLGSSTGGIVLVSELLVGSILPFVEATGVSQLFIGLILIPLFSNVVDHVVAISVALKNRMDLSLTISVGSAAQIACLVLPVVVLVGWATGRPQGLIFAPLELVAMAVGLGLMVPVLLDGKSNWLEGAQLATCYLVLVAVLWVT